MASVGVSVSEKHSQNMRTSSTTTNDGAESVAQCQINFYTFSLCTFISHSDIEFKCWWRYCFIKWWHGFTGKGREPVIRKQYGRHVHNCLKCKTPKENFYFSRFNIFIYTYKNILGFFSKRCATKQLRHGYGNWLNKKFSKLN